MPDKVPSRLELKEAFRRHEETLLDFLDNTPFSILKNGAMTSLTPRWEQLARDHIEQAFMCLERALKRS